MQKKAKISLKTNEENIDFNTLIEIKNNKINYLEEDNTNVLFDINKKRLIRDNKDIYLEYDFKNSKGSIYIKEFKCETKVNIKLKNLIMKKEKIEIEYEIEENKYLYKIEME